MRAILCVMVLAGVVMAQDAVRDVQEAEYQVTVPARIVRPSVVYQPAKSIEDGDTVQVLVRYKPKGGAWVIPWRREYSPNIPVDGNTELLLKVRAEIRESPKPTISEEE